MVAAQSLLDAGAPLLGREILRGDSHLDAVSVSEIPRGLLQGHRIAGDEEQRLARPGKLLGQRAANSFGGTGDHHRRRNPGRSCSLHSRAFVVHPLTSNSGY